MAPRGSEQHADTVMSQAKEYFSFLGSKNIFQPKVLAKVSRNSVFLVGCSMAVSSFLRPICLHNRIATFKCRLREAVVLNRPLDPCDQREQWSSSAFMRGRQDDRAPGNRQGKRETGYTEPKNPCRNCQVMFQNLKGFIPANAEAENRDTFQGACAEYIPVSELIKDDIRDRPTVAVQNKLEVHLEKCIYLCKNYRKIADECCNCYNPDRTLKKDQKLLNAAYHKVPHIHIFGFKPELKM